MKPAIYAGRRYQLERRWWGEAGSLEPTDVVSYDNALAETVNGLFKAELHRNPAALANNGGPWKGLDDLEVATCAWVSWFDEERLHAEVEADYYARLVRAEVA